MMETLSKLWSLAEREAERTGKTFREAFGDIGLHLERPPEPASDGYDVTPLNSSTFSDTGGDGTHFGFVHVDGKFRENSPIVMTVPASSDIQHVIVGENLLEFLRLGCRIGYYQLEELAYDREEFIKWMNSLHPQHYTGTAFEFDGDADWADKISQDKILLEILTREFSLRPWHNVGHRLDELNKNYLAQLEIRA